MLLSSASCSIFQLFETAVACTGEFPRSSLKVSRLIFSLEISVAIALL